MPERSAVASAAGTGAQGSSGQSSGWGAPVIDPDPLRESSLDASDATQFPPGSESIAEEIQWKPVEPPPVQEEPPAAAIVPASMAKTETAASSGPVPDVVAENSINDMAENRVNIALFHIERLKQLVPDITGWSEQQASSVDTAISALETSLKGREAAGDPYQALRETLKIAKRNPRDIDLMIALADRAGEIEDLLSAHDQYSASVRDALFAIKPAAVNYVTSATKRPAQRRPAKRAAAKNPPEPATDETANPATGKEPAGTADETAER